MMTSALALIGLVAASDAGAAFEETLDAAASTDSKTAIIVGMIAIGLSLALLVTYTTLRRRARFGSPARVLSRQLGLGLPSQRLLGRVARKVNLPGAAPMLISRGCFDHSVKRYPARQADASRLASIRERVFSE